MTITICGSCTFVDEMAKAQKHLQNKGFTVFAPDPLVTEEWYKENYGKIDLLKMKPIWTKKHWKKIESSDAVLIINNNKKGIAGYFGSNTLMELSVSYYLGKKIYLLNSLPENHPHYEELSTIDAIVLEGNLDKIRE